MVEDGFSNEAEYQREQQLFFFFPEADADPVLFHSPFEVEGYPKDPNWRPVVTEAEVRTAAIEFRAL